MSTKIYYGFRIATADFFEAHEIVNKFKEEARKLFSARYFKHVAYTACRVADAVALGKYKQPEDSRGSCPLIVAWDDITTNYKKIYAGAGSQRNPLYDYDTHLTLFPVEGQFLVMYHGETRHFSEVYDLWESMDGVEYFGYWNNTDQPEDVTDEEWDERCRLWNIALPGAGVPATSGYTTEVMGIYGLPAPMANEVVAAANEHYPREERAKRWAKDLLIDEKFYEHREGKPIEELENHEVFGLLRAAQKYVSDNPDKVETRAAEILPQLPEITSDVLTEKFDEPSES